MIAKLKQMFGLNDQVISAEEQINRLNLSAASLLLEVIMADDELSDEESALLPELLRKSVSLSDEDIESLIEDAKLSRGNSTSLFEFTAEINAHFDLKQKQELLLTMWKLAYADGELCRYEDQIIRRIADLLYLKHSEVIQMRNLAIESTAQ